MQFEKAGELNIDRGASQIAIMQRTAEEATNAYSKLLNDIVTSGSLTDPVTGRPYVPTVTILDATRKEFDTLEDQLETQQETNQGILDKHVSSVRQCNTDRANAFAGDGGVVDLMTKMTAARDTHGTCRDNEDVAIGLMEAECDKFKGLKRCGIEDQNWYAVSDAKNGQDNSLDTVVSQAGICRKEVVNVTTYATQCDKDQDTFKAAFCAYEDKLVDTCATLDTCYAGAVKNHQKANFSISKLEEEQKTMYRMVKRVHCYLDLLFKAAKSEGAASAMPTATQIKACNDLVPTSSALDDSALDIKKTDLDAKDACGFEDGAKGHTDLKGEKATDDYQPGTQKFYDEELEDYKKHGKLKDNTVC